MIPAPFTYRRVWSVDEALELAGQSGDDAKFLAGGHSLLPLMKLRFAVPDILIDIGRLGELSFIRDEDTPIAVGALTTHHDLATSGLLARELPLLAHAAGCAGDPQIRHRGTIGGSLAHGDPAGDLPAVILALDATLIALGPAGRREVGAAEFIRGLFETALAPGELLTEIRIPKPRDTAWSFQKFTKRAIDWAIVGVPVQGGNVALVNMGPAPLRAAAVEQALAAGAAPADAAAHAAEGQAPSTTSTQTAATGSTWPGCSSPAPWLNHARAPDGGRPAQAEMADLGGRGRRDHAACGWAARWVRWGGVWVGLSL